MQLLKSIPSCIHCRFNRLFLRKTIIFFLSSTYLWCAITVVVFCFSLAATKQEAFTISQQKKTKQRNHARRIFFFFFARIKFHQHIWESIDIVKRKHISMSLFCWLRCCLGVLRCVDGCWLPMRVWLAWLHGAVK